MIIFSDIYEALRKEKYSEQLQKLPKTFLQDAASYFAEKSKIASKQQNMFSDEIVRARKQLENAIQTLNELLLRREKKILEMAAVAARIGISKSDFENMLENEKELFDAVVKKLEENERIIEELMKGKREEKDLKNMLVRFEEDMQEFLADKSYGPFNKGDIVNMPGEIAKILLGEKKVVQVPEKE